MGGTHAQFTRGLGPLRPPGKPEPPGDEAAPNELTTPIHALHFLAYDLESSCLRLIMS